MLAMPRRLSGAAAGAAILACFILAQTSDQAGAQSATSTAAPTATAARTATPAGTVGTATGTVVGTATTTPTPRPTVPTSTPAPVRTLVSGAVARVDGLPYIWVADDGGVLHWVGDTRALLNLTPNWAEMRDLTREQLVELARTKRIGAPALSAGLVKLGDAIYLVRWEVDQTSPTLMRIAEAVDLDVFGVSGENYGVVMDGSAWQERFGVPPDSLTKGALSSVVYSPTPTVTPTPMPTATPVPTITNTPGPVVTMKARFEGTRRTGDPNEATESFFTITEALPRVRLKLTAWIREYNCSIGCTKADSTTEVRWGPVDAGITDANGRLNYHDTHLPYQFYRYTFEDPYGNKVTVDGRDDL
jgi:hypothetical protein